MEIFEENMLCGVHIGEHGFDADGVIAEITERVIKPGYNFVTIRTRARFGDIIPKETYIKWAKFLRENKIYFIFLYSICLMGGVMRSSFTKDMIDDIKREAGEYFLGDMFGELGSCFGGKLKGYGTTNPYLNPKQDHSDVKSAADAFCEIIGEYVATDKELGMPYLSIVEPTAISKYIIAGGIDLPMLELMIANPDWMLPYIRGMSRAYCRTWGTYMAHEWYGGMRHSDTLKRKRLFLGARYAYLAGSRVFCIESGDEMITAYGQRHEADSELCQEYRDMLSEINSLASTDKRDKAGPRVKLAFVSGRYDAWCGGWGGSTAFGQYDREEWGYSSAEWSYRFLSELGVRRTWCDIENYGDEDLSSLPAYGSYDIIPIEAGLDTLTKYDYLIFLGWNSMTDEDMDNLTEYVRRGGKLLMSVAHLNYSVKRNGEFIPPSPEKMRALFGATLSGENLRTNNGIKFNGNTTIEGFLYPVSLPNQSDPILGCGYTTYAGLNLEGATPIGRIGDGFKSDSKEWQYVVIENKVGEGSVILDCSMDYPGAPAAYPLYRMLAHEMVTLSARSADIKVVGPDRLRYSVYEDGKIYLLNTDYDLPITVKVIKDGKTSTYTLEALELKILEP